VCDRALRLQNADGRLELSNLPVAEELLDRRLPRAVEMLRFVALPLCKRNVLAARLTSNVRHAEPPGRPRSTVALSPGSAAGVAALQAKQNQPRTEPPLTNWTISALHRGHTGEGGSTAR